MQCRWHTMPNTAIIGPVRAKRLLNDSGEDFLASMLVDNVSKFINLMDAKATSPSAIATRNAWSGPWPKRSPWLKTGRGYVPESGLDSLNRDGHSVEMVLARQLIAV